MAELLGGVGDTIVSGLQSILYATIYKLLYYLAVGCCWIIDLLYSMFEIMSGLSKVSYNGDYDYLINIFFSNTTVSKIYWGMALIGLAAGFAFAIAAVIKKMFDTSEKEKRSYGQILTGLFKSMLTIVCMSMIITMVLNATTLLMQQINYVFDNADSLGDETTITYTDEEYAAMTRVYCTIGNFSLNPSYNNRYNLNKCFNEIRMDLQYLKNNGVFSVHYVTKDMQGNPNATWQGALEKIANSASLERDLSLDAYHESTSNAILQAMEFLKVDGSFKPLKEYKRTYVASRNSIPMDRLLFLMSTLRAAKNEDYNRSPSMTDPLRSAYYYGEKSIYDLDAVNEDFDIGIAAFDYVVLFLACYKMLQTLVTIILNCVGRIFNMLLLYLISPLIISVSALDDGGKFKQWMTAFIVQSFSVFGTVISMRVLLLFMPIVLRNDLVLFENGIANLLTKLVIILGACEVSEKATNLITGILADNAGWQSITAGDMSGTARSMLATGKSIAGGGVKAAVGAGLLAGYGTYFGAKAAVTGVKATAAGGKAVVRGGMALASKISAWRNSGKSGGDGGGAAVGNSTNQQTNPLPQNQHDVNPGETNTTGVTGPTGPAPAQPIGGTNNPIGMNQTVPAPAQPIGGTNNPIGTNQTVPAPAQPIGGTNNPTGTNQTVPAPTQPIGGTNNPIGTNRTVPAPARPIGGTNNPIGTNQTVPAPAQPIDGTNNPIGTNQTVPAPTVQQNRPPLKQPPKAARPRNNNNT